MNIVLLIGKINTNAYFRYYVDGEDSKQNVEYFADDWGFHPYVEYSNIGPHSRSRTHLALGEEAVKAYRNQNKVFINNYISPSINIIYYLLHFKYKNCSIILLFFKEIYICLNT